MPWSTAPTCTRSSVWRAERGKLSKEDIVTARANGKLANRERLIYRSWYTLVITILMEVKPF